MKKIFAVLMSVMMLAGTSACSREPVAHEEVPVDIKTISSTVLNDLNLDRSVNDEPPMKLGDVPSSEAQARAEELAKDGEPSAMATLFSDGKSGEIVVVTDEPSDAVREWANQAVDDNGYATVETTLFPQETIEVGVARVNGKNTYVVVVEFS